MIGLKLRDEFLASHMPGTAIALRTGDHQGAAQKSADQILNITYPTADILTALRAVSDKRSGRPVVLMGDRGRGKSHIMAVMHHAVQSPAVVEGWLRDWSVKLHRQDLSHLSMMKGFTPISEPVHNHEYPLLWNLLFDRHPKGDYYRGQFENMPDHHAPPRSLLEKMFEDHPVCLILDEFQTWFTGLPEKDKKSGANPQQLAFNFIQNLSEIAKDRPEILMFVISLLNNRNSAFQQVHRQGPVLIDFRGPSAKDDRLKLLLHRLFVNRDHISHDDIRRAAGVYADERFRLLYADKSEAERARIQNEVFDSFPFSPELISLLDHHILMSEAAQNTRDQIRILAQVYKTRGNSTPIITPADFFVDGNAEEIQSLIDSIAQQAGQERLREIAQRNLESVQAFGVQIPNARELISAIWMRSMSPMKHQGASPVSLHLDITKNQPTDDNAFHAELAALIEHSVNIHGDDVPGGPLRFALEENPRSKVRASAKNDKLWLPGAMTASSQTAYPEKDVNHIRNTLRYIMSQETAEPPSRVIVPGVNWKTDPWTDADEADKPAKWDRPALMVIPDQIPPGNLNAVLGNWLAKHVTGKRNTVRFLLLGTDDLGLFTDSELIYTARCSFLCSREGWGADPTYWSLYQEFDRPLRQMLKIRFSRFAVLRKWDYQKPENCVFDVEKISEPGGKIPAAVETKILKDLFDRNDFKSFILKRAKASDTVGALMDDLKEPPPPNTGDALPFIGETRTYECILDIAAEGVIALNVSGNWIFRRSEDANDEDAKRYIRSKAFRTGQEMRQVQLGLPGVTGGTAVTTTDLPEDPTAGKDTPTSEYTGGTGADAAVNVSEGKKPIGTEITDITHPKILPESVPKIMKSAEPATGINLSGCFEKWGIPSDKGLESATIEFQGVSVQQVRQILQRIPSTFKASLEITFQEVKRSS